VAMLTLAVLLPDYQLDNLSLWLIAGLLALSLDFIWGYGGILSFGQTAFYGVAGYAFGVIGVNWESYVGTSIVLLAGSALVGAIFAATLGYFLFYSRIGEVQVAIITYAVTLVLLTVATGLQKTIGAAIIGGENGMTNIPSLQIGGRDIGSQGTYLVVILIGLGVFLILQALVRAPFGRIVIGMRVNELRTELLGYDVRLYRLIVFTIGGVIAGLAGGLFAAWGNFINTDVFSPTNAALVVIWVLVGGRGTMVGAFLGAFLVQALTYNLGGGAGAGQATLILGIILILIVIFARGGIISLALFAWSCVRGRFGLRRRTEEAETAGEPPRESLRLVEYESDSPSETRTSDEGMILETEDVSKRFGGLQAVKDVSLGFEDRRVFCLIGPNGAGKSTYFNMLVGRYRPDSGTIFYRGQNITRWEPARRVRAGIGIKLQVASIFGDLPVRENVWLAAYSRARSSREASRICDSTLQDIGLTHRAQELAQNLAHGEQQWLEIGMVLALAPDLILLDEPTAGMTREETERTANLIQQLAQHATVIVVEHDMDFVRKLAAPTIVFHQGQVFAQGSIEELRQNQRILDIYLGRRAREA
jgi:branched-chain amino acid transport system permease protein